LAFPLFYSTAATEAAMAALMEADGTGRKQDLGGRLW
jgi:hypothetical protein